MRISLEIRSYNSNVCVSNAIILGVITRSKQVDHNIEKNEYYSKDQVCAIIWRGNN